MDVGVSPLWIYDAMVDMLVLVLGRKTGLVCQTLWLKGFFLTFFGVFLVPVGLDLLLFRVSEFFYCLADTGHDLKQVVHNL